MRFDDSLKTVLASDAAPGFGAQATWRQLVDLIGRGRVAATPATLAQLRSLRGEVPASVRAASARSLAFAQPPAALVALFVEDELTIAAPVLRTATLTSEEWLGMLPALTPQGRSLLRHRRDLPAAVGRGLASFGSVDFVIGHEPAETAAPMPEPSLLAPPRPAANDAGLADRSPSIVPTPPVVPLADTRAMPQRGSPAAPAAVPPSADRFEIADLVARIDAFQRERPEPAATPMPIASVDGFRFETDATGAIRWVDGVPRAALVGVSVAASVPQGLAQLDGIAVGAFRRRARFVDARLAVQGGSTAAGDWRLTAAPSFDPASGRFTGYRGEGRRPRPDKVATPRDANRAASESLRQLVHELRTPTNAIAGFAELIETQLLGPVAPPYREQAGAIRTHTMALLGAIDDLDTAARIAGRALELRPASVAVEPLVARVLADLSPLAALRGAVVVFKPDGEHRVTADDRALERLVGRLLAALVAAAGRGERLRVKVKAKDGATVAIQIDRPAALASIGDDELLAIDADRDASEGAPLLGTGFALRLARNLADELGGSLAIGAERLTLRFPAALDREVGQAAE